MNLEVKVKNIPVVNFAMQQNHVPVVREVAIFNNGDTDYADLDLTVSFEPEFAQGTTIHIASLPARDDVRITPVINCLTSYLSNLTERISGFVRVELTHGGKFVSSQMFDIAVLAFDQWGGTEVLPEMLASFVTPNVPQISPVLKRASEILEAWSGSSALDEYQTKNPNRVKQQMAAVYEAIAERNISYCTVPASFETRGQRIRLCGDVLSAGLGTCLDLTLLYASCLEAIGLHPLLVLTEGHALAGAWLVDNSFPDTVNDDASMLINRYADGVNEILLVETTAMTDNRKIPFDVAVSSANRKVATTGNLNCFVDVFRARGGSIRPLPLRVLRDGVYDIDDAPEPSRVDVEAPMELSETDEVRYVQSIEVDKLKIWERKLLDMSMRNNLLNTHFSRGTVPLIAVNPCRLEDALADGWEFQLYPRPTDWDNTSISQDVFMSVNATDPMTKLVTDEFENHRLRTWLDEISLKATLTNLFRKSRLSIEENGANTLYLALGMLKWYETDKSQLERYAPILLVPIEIVRLTFNKGFVIRSRDEETMVNVTLIEWLRQMNGISIGDLNTLPADISGADVRRIFNVFRHAILNQQGWAVEEVALIGNFSFSKFIMWNDIHNNIGCLQENPIVSALITGNSDGIATHMEEDSGDLDAKYPVGEISLPFDVDSSQFQAICAAMSGQSFILHGPPGTGKSQTITNIIANALYKGLKVLFVAEKMAALQVVQRRLDSIGLSPFCLELHSNKAKKSAVLEQLRRAAEVVKESSDHQYGITAQNLNNLRSELNRYIHILHMPRRAGFSIYDCICRYAGISSDVEPVEIASDTLAAMTPENKACADITVDEYATACCICGGPHLHPLSGIHISDYTRQIQGEAAGLIGETLSLVNELRQVLSDISAIIGVDVTDIPQKKNGHLMDIVRFMASVDDTAVAMLRATRNHDYIPLIASAIETGRKYMDKRDSILASYTRNIFTADVNDMETRWNQGKIKWWLPRTLAFNKVRSQLRALTSGNAKPDNAAIEATFADYRDCTAYRLELAACDSFMLPILGSGWIFADIDWQYLDTSLAAVKKLYRQTALLAPSVKASSTAFETIYAHFENGAESFLDINRDKLERYLELCRKVEDNCVRIRSLINTSSLNAASNSHRVETLSRWYDAMDRLHDWTAYIAQRNKLTDMGLSDIVKAVENGACQPEDIVTFYNKSFFRSYVEYIIAGEPDMANFHGTLYEDKVKRFKDMNRIFEKLTRHELVVKLSSSLPVAGDGSGMAAEMAILRRNIRNRGRGTSIRRLFEQIPDLLTAMCPCMLMSPISVAQYIDPHRSPFDLVIFDEASQMPTSEAVGAIARGRNMIVVGDPKQMPPTDFFNRNTYDEDNADIEDLESILDDCLALSIPSRHLLWHYRSKHESLISFSNAKYYDNSLLTFPSPDDLASKVGWQYVPGIYDRGNTRQNRAEAEAVVEEIRQRLANPQQRSKSMGVVTFNTNQQSLIEDLLTDMFQRNPELESIAMECEEPIFVKNLENVQGDERDVILFSIGYGPDKEGKITLNFGPLNREGGYRRLNVAVSRARYEMKVFSTLRADQIDLNRTSAPGVADLKAFLEYAEKGRHTLCRNVHMHHAVTDALVADIAAELKARGYSIRTDVGSSGYKIDIGVVNPSCPDTYLLGILCDGTNSKASRTALDRFVTQHSVLGKLGWNIHRVWSLDWWENKERTINAILKAIESAQKEKILS